jgi:predicted amidophosphoribosyltransferase
MFCDFCGNKLANDAKYCRRCGGQQRDKLGDTQPLPVIDEATLSRTKLQTFYSEPGKNSNFKQKTSQERSKIGRIMYNLLCLAIFVLVIYILMTFKTIREYQILTGILGSLLVVYIRWKR